MSTEPAALQAAQALVSSSNYVTLCTKGTDGFPAARVLFNLQKQRASVFSQGLVPRSEFGTWLGTNLSSAKNQEISQDPRVCLYYTNTDSFEGLSLSGYLELEQDPAIRAAIYDPAWDIYYPGGIDGGDFALYRFVAHQGKYYHGMRVVQFHVSP